MGKTSKPAPGGGGAGGGGKGKGGAERPEGKLVTDSRFAAVHFDPRFQRFPKAKAKVEIDERFAGALGSSAERGGPGGCSVMQRLRDFSAPLAASTGAVASSTATSCCALCLLGCRDVQGPRIPSQGSGGQAGAQGAGAALRAPLLLCIIVFGQIGEDPAATCPAAPGGDVN